MYSYGPPLMTEQKQNDQLEHTYSSYVKIRDVVQKTCRRRWTIGKSDEWGSGISVRAARPRLFSWAVWHSCRMGARNQEQTRGRIGPQLRLGNLRVGELHFCPLCTALDQASSLSRKLAYVPGPTFGSWNCLPHQAHIALSEPMSSTDKQGSSLGSFPTFPSPLSPL